MSFAKEMKDVQKKLELAGHQCLIPEEIDEYISGVTSGSNIQRKIEKDCIRTHYRFIQESDAILLLNYDKKDIAGYVGGNSFLEIGFAYILDKKIFLLNPTPQELSYSDEIEAMKPIILSGDLCLIQ